MRSASPVHQRQTHPGFSRINVDPPALFQLDSRLFGWQTSALAGAECLRAGGAVSNKIATKCFGTWTSNGPYAKWGIGENRLQVFETVVGPWRLERQTSTVSRNTFVSAFYFGFILNRCECINLSWPSIFVYQLAKFNQLG